MSWTEMFANLRQWTYPTAFRIVTADAQGCQETLSEILAQLESLRQAVLKLATPPLEKVPDKLAIQAGNSCFWIGRLVKQMESEGIKNKETRSIKTNLRKLIAILEGNNIRCIDVEGQAYDDGRNDFEPLGEEELKPGLSYKTIIRCDYPVIMSGEQLLQKANGVVARPA